MWDLRKKSYLKERKSYKFTKHIDTQKRKRQIPLELSVKESNTKEHMYLYLI